MNIRAWSGCECQTVARKRLKEAADVWSVNRFIQQSLISASDTKGSQSDADITAEQHESVTLRKMLLKQQV